MMKKEQGFSIVEMMIVLVVVGGLATFGIFTYNSSFPRSRNAQRLNDLKNYRTSLELYYSKNNSYPIRDTGPENAAALCGPAELNLTTEECKSDPKGGTYLYMTDNGGENYNLWVKLENSTQVYVMCSNGMTGYVSEADEPVNATCPSADFI